MMRRLSIGAAIAACVAVTGSAGAAGPPANGVAAKPPKGIVAATVATIRAASSFRVVGKIAGTGLRATVDERLGKGGGTATLGFTGFQVQLIRVGSSDYLKSSAAFWESLGSQLAKTSKTSLIGKWVRIPNGDSLAEFASGFTDRDSLADSLASEPGTLRRAAGTTFRGKLAVGLVEPTDKSTLWVATTGPPRPLAIVGPAAAGSAVLLFEDWNAPFTPAAPEHAVTP